MERRAFISGITLGLLAAPFAVGAQPAGKVYRIGYLGVAPIPPDDAFRAGLRDLGYLGARRGATNDSSAEDGENEP